MNQNINIKINKTKYKDKFAVNNNIHNNYNHIHNKEEFEIMEITDDMASLSFSSNEYLSDIDISSDDGCESTPQSTPSPPAPIKHSNSDSKLLPLPSTSIVHHSHSCDNNIYNKHETVHSQYHGDRTLVIFDWDDTLHPTSACQSGSKLDIELIHKFCLSVYETLLTMIRLYGSQNIYIVSNADKLWIERCLNQLSGGYFINIYHLISLYQIQIISAKNEFSKQFPNDSTKWKQLTFEHLVKKHYLKYNQKLYLHHIKNIKLNTPTIKPLKFCVICIGDSQHEYIASKRVINRLNVEKIGEKKILLHRIKLLQNPSLPQLIEQYDLIKKMSHLLKTKHDEINIDYARAMKHFHSKQSKLNI